MQHINLLKSEQIALLPKTPEAQCDQDYFQDDGK
jgi:hypothetical protein